MSRHLHDRLPVINLTWLSKSLNKSLENILLWNNLNNQVTKQTTKQYSEDSTHKVHVSWPQCVYISVRIGYSKSSFEHMFLRKYMLLHGIGSILHYLKSFLGNLPFYIKIYIILGLSEISDQNSS